MSYILAILERLDINTPEGAKVFRNYVPAFVHPETKKMYVGRRGETHNDIIDKYPHEIDPIHKDMMNSHDRGFYNTLHKTFTSKAQSGWDSSDLMSIRQRELKFGATRQFGFESLLEIELDQKLKYRLIPAVIHPETGKMYTGKRGQIHGAIINQHDIPHMMYPSVYQKNTGYYDPLNKKYHSRKDLGGLDTSELASSRTFRIRNFGNESSLLMNIASLN